MNKKVYCKIKINNKILIEFNIKIINEIQLIQQICKNKWDIDLMIKMKKIFNYIILTISKTYKFRIKNNKTFNKMIKDNK